MNLSDSPSVAVARYAFIGAVCCSLALSAAAQIPNVQGQPAPAGQNPAPAAVALPTGYAIGVDDLLTVSFWQDKELSAEVVVRPDGKISLPLLGDVAAVGLTPEQLSTVVEKAASKFITEPDATVIVREVRSRKVFVVGEVVRPGVVLLNAEMNVLQVLASVGGLLEFADKSDLTIVRTENGQERRFKFNYSEVLRGRRMGQNIPMQPGDTILVH